MGGISQRGGSVTITATTARAVPSARREVRPSEIIEKYKRGLKHQLAALEELRVYLEERERKEQ